MGNYFEEAREMLESNEKIIKEISVQRSGLLKRSSTLILLTNKRIIYLFDRILSDKFKSIPLSEISGISYLPQLLHSAGILKIITKNGKAITISPSFVGQGEAQEFISEVKKSLSDQ